MILSDKDDKKCGDAPRSISKKIRNDVILVLVLLTAILAVLIPVISTRQEGTYVTVTINGEHYGTYPLSENREVVIDNPLSEAYLNVLVIKDGKAYVSEANCKDLICSRHAPIHISGESIVCLPHKLAITVEAENRDVDIIG